MGFGSKGILIRRQSTETTRASVVITTGFTFEGTGRTITRTAGIWDTSAGGDGYKPGMRIHFLNASLNTGVYTIRSAVSSRVITVYEPLTDQAAATSAQCIGHEYENIGEVVSFSGPSGAVSIVDVTHLCSSAKEKVVGFVDEGQMTFEVNFLPGASYLHTRLLTDRQARTKARYDIKLSDSGTNSSSQPTAFNFEGYVLSVVPSGGVDNALRAAVTIEITGEAARIQRFNGDEL